MKRLAVFGSAFLFLFVALFLTIPMNAQASLLYAENFEDGQANGIEKVYSWD